MVFDLRTEAEMRLHSEKTARELALKKQREEGSENSIVAQEPSRADEGHAPTETTAATGPEPVG
jgi:hypothetical protein